MATSKILNKDVQEIISGVKIEFPKYTTQVMNLANSNAQATRPKNVGQLSDLIQEFKGNKISEWRSFYTEKYPNSIKVAAKKVHEMCVTMGMDKNITPELVEMWVDDLIITKTFIGLKYQEGILAKIAKIKGTTYTLATPEDEKDNIDGTIGGVEVSVKPITYKSKILSEEIKVPIIYYTKKKDGISIEWDF
jgi:hypothetical protein